MVDCEQVLQDERAMYRPSLALGVDGAVAPLWTGPDGAGPTSSEYSLGFKTTLRLHCEGGLPTLTSFGRPRIAATERVLPL